MLIWYLVVPLIVLGLLANALLMFAARHDPQSPLSDEWRRTHVRDHGDGEDR